LKADVRGAFTQCVFGCAEARAHQLKARQQSTNMSYTVFVQKFANGEPSAFPFALVVSILQRYGDVGDAGGRLEFTPADDDLCEVGFVGGSEAKGIESVIFERPVSGGRLAPLVFELLGLPGMCYYELDCSYVLARTEITAELPPGLADMCEPGTVTVISSASEVPL
jgi:hypothetical protein